jgi:hypothetical protein
VRSDWKTGRVEVRWRPEAVLDLARLKKDLFTWRGGVRYGSAEVVASGQVEEREGTLSLRLDGTAQRMSLRAARGVVLPAPGARVRVAGEAALPREPGTANLVLTVREYEPLPASLP